jgi:hypothetical protein
MELSSHGWACLHFRNGDRFHLIDGASYVTDILGDLVRTAVDVVSYSWRSAMSLENEPGEWRLICEGETSTRPDNKIAISYLTFAELAWPLQPEGDRVEAFHTS